tara:strand:+ start:1309 stop:1572 length:264 start_codon:yes stop_codon:yes gene_type:complete
MFKEFFKRIYKSRKTIPKEKADALKNDIRILKELIDKRQKQIKKFEGLVISDPEHEKKYLERITIHKGLVKEHLQKIEEIEMILLDS